MRKGLNFCFAVISIFLITGCGEKTLKCTRENNSYDDQMKMTQNLNVSFSGDKASSLNFTMDVSLSKELIDSNPDIASELADTASSEFDDIKDKHGISYSMSKSDNGFTSKLKINFNKVDDETKKKIYLINHQSSYSTIKRNLERDGYSCK